MNNNEMIETLDNIGNALCEFDIKGRQASTMLSILKALKSIKDELMVRESEENRKDD